jgi:hypothetical protein
LTRGKINKSLKKYRQVLENQNDVFDQGKNYCFIKQEAPPGFWKKST